MFFFSLSLAKSTIRRENNEKRQRKKEMPTNNKLEKKKKSSQSSNISAYVFYVRGFQCVVLTQISYFWQKIKKNKNDTARRNKRARTICIAIEETFTTHTHSTDACTVHGDYGTRVKERKRAHLHKLAVLPV